MMLRRLDPSPNRRRRPSPSVRLGLAGLVAVGGAWLIGLWAVGVVLMVEAAFFVLLVWDDGRAAVSRSSQHDQVLDRWRQAR